MDLYDEYFNSSISISSRHTAWEFLGLESDRLIRLTGDFGPMVEIIYSYSLPATKMVIGKQIIQTCFDQVPIKYAGTFTDVSNKVAALASHQLSAMTSMAVYFTRGQELH